MQGAVMLPVPMARSVHVAGMLCASHSLGSCDVPHSAPKAVFSWTWTREATSGDGNGLQLADRPCFTQLAQSDNPTGPVVSQNRLTVQGSSAYRVL